MVLMDKLTEIPKRKCDLCGKNKENSIKYGQLYTLENISVHYYCLLLSNNALQRGKDNEGILGFLLKDIKNLLKNSNNDICSYCHKGYATLMCSKNKCKKKYHLPCGLKNGSMSQFFGLFKNYCSTHRPGQKIPKKYFCAKSNTFCSICYKLIHFNKTSSLKKVLWAPCCKKTWYHKYCIQKLAYSAGYLFKCAICNDSKRFRQHMLRHGVFIPDRDASWELVPNAYEELLFKYNNCDADKCKCPEGREKNIEDTIWEIILCYTCGSQGIHIACGGLKFLEPKWNCNICSKIIHGNSKFVEKKSKSDNLLATINSIEEPHSDIPCSSKITSKSLSTFENKRKKRKLSTEMKNFVFEKKRKVDADLLSPDELIDIETIDAFAGGERICNDREIVPGSNSSNSSPLSEEPIRRGKEPKKSGNKVIPGPGKNHEEILLDSSESENEVIEMGDSSDEGIQIVKEIKHKNKRNILNNGNQRTRSKMKSPNQQLPKKHQPLKTFISIYNVFKYSKETENLDEAFVPNSSDWSKGKCFSNENTIKKCLSEEVVILDDEVL